MAKRLKLSPEASRLYRSIQKEFGIDDAPGKLLLKTAMERFDAYRKCQAVVNEEGLTVIDRYGQVKSHPLTTTMRDAFSQFLLSMKALNLDLEPLKNIGRPPGTGNGGMRNAN